MTREKAEGCHPKLGLQALPTAMLPFLVGQIVQLQSQTRATGSSDEDGCIKSFAHGWLQSQTRATGSSDDCLRWLVWRI